MSDSRILEQLVAASRELYSLPAVAMQVLELTSHPRVDATRLKDCIEQDPALSAKLLRVVNSSLFGLSSPVGNLAQAVALLGIQPLKLLVLGFSLPERLFDGVSSAVLGRYWKYTLTKAVSAREVARRYYGVAGDEAFIAGLLGDLGLLALVQGLGESYVRFLDRAWFESGELARHERRALGFDHVQMTVQLLNQWNLPWSIVEGVTATVIPSPDEPLDDAAHTPTLGLILRQAGLLARLLCVERGEALADLLAVDPGRIPREDLPALVESLNGRVAQLAEVLKLDLPEGRGYREILDEAHRLLALTAAQAAANLATAHDTPAARIERQDLDEAERQLVDEIRILSESAAEFCKPPAAARIAAKPAHRAAAKPAATATQARPAAVPCGATEPSAPTKHMPEALQQALVTAVSACRQSRRALSLLLIELNNFVQLHEADGLGYALFSGEQIDQQCRLLDHTSKLVLSLGRYRWAIVLTGCDRSLAVELGHALRRAAQDAQPIDATLPPAISVGAATVSAPSRNFLVDTLYDAAERCRHASQLSGGASVKSIEIY